MPAPTTQPLFLLDALIEAPLVRFVTVALLSTHPPPAFPKEHAVVKHPAEPSGQRRYSVCVCGQRPPVRRGLGPHARAHRISATADGDDGCCAPDFIALRKGAGGFAEILEGAPIRLNRPYASRTYPLLGQVGTGIRRLIHSKCGGRCPAKFYISRRQGARIDCRDRGSRW